MLQSWSPKSKGIVYSVGFSITATQLIICVKGIAARVIKHFLRDSLVIECLLCFSFCSRAAWHVCIFGLTRALYILMLLQIASMFTTWLTTAVCMQVCAFMRMFVKHVRMYVCRHLFSVCVCPGICLNAQAHITLQR